MIADKFQVRATGPVDPITMQPIKGRKRAGGIRFGEMERDALIGHGIALTLQDRLLNCSDRDAAHVCTRCGSLLSVSMMTTMGINRTNDDDNGISDHSRRPCCRSCDSDDRVQVVQVPRVFRYLTAELVAMNIKVQLKAESYADAAGR
jgi:DNA-directed RNA polymerase I subunit RPA2